MAEKEMNEEISFEELLKASSESPGRRVRPGERISGRGNAFIRFLKE